MSDKPDTLRTIVIAGYALQAAGFITGGLGNLVAVILAYVKRDDARGTWQESHFSWRLRSVLWAIVLYAVTFPFFLLGLLIFNPAWVLISIWFLYRIVSGMIAMNKNRAIQS